MIKLLIVDDQSLIREGLKMVTSLCSDFKVVGEAANGREALDRVKELTPDVVLMDIRMPVLNGVEATKIIKESFPGVKVLILTTFNEDEYIFQCLKNGADGYILKDVKSDELIRGIQTVYNGNMLLQPEVATRVVKAFKNMNTKNEKVPCEGPNVLESLTPRELDIARLVSMGKSNREICEELFLTEGTVKNHLTKILDKLELRDRTQLALFMNERKGNM